MTARPTLADVIAAHRIDWEDSEFAWCSGGCDLRWPLLDAGPDHAKHVAEMWRLARIARTVEDLDALPVPPDNDGQEDVTAVLIRSATGQRYTRAPTGGWYPIEDPGCWRSETIALPALIVWHPDDEHGVAG